MRLYTHPLSQNARKVRIVASHLGLKLQESHVDLMTGAGKSTDYLKTNPNGMVPTLVDEGFVLWESNAICQYLASRKPSGLWPADDTVRADIARWQFWESAHWFPALFYFFKENMIKKLLLGGEPDASELLKGETLLTQFGGVLNNQLESRQFLVGDSFTLADISIAVHLMHAQVSAVPLDRFPNVERWFENISKMPAWRATEPANI